MSLKSVAVTSDVDDDGDSLGDVSLGCVGEELQGLWVRGWRGGRLPGACAKGVVGAVGARACLVGVGCGWDVGLGA